MKLILKQKILSWFGTYHVYDEQDNVLFTIKGELSWGHKLRIYDKDGNEVGMIAEEILHFLATFNIIVNNENIGQIKRKLSLFIPEYEITNIGWKVKGDFWNIKFAILNNSGEEVGLINRKLFRLHDTYEIEVHNEQDALYALIIGLTMDIMSQKAASAAAASM